MLNIIALFGSVALVIMALSVIATMIVGNADAIVAALFARPRQGIRPARVRRQRPAVRTPARAVRQPLRAAA